MKKYLSFLILVLLFFVMQCSKEDMTSPQDDLQTGEMVFDESDTDYYQGALAKGNIELVNEIRLKYFAKALAKNLTSPGACKLLKQEIGKKFDGDFDLLWETVRDENISGKGKFRKLISDRLSKGKGSFISIDDVEEVPLLQVSLPVNFEDWDGEEPIKVAYTPLMIDDTECDEIYAYDSEGNEYVLDVKTPPDFPVIVVGINERVDPVTKKLYFGKDRKSLGRPNPDDPPNPPPGTIHTDVILDHVYLQDDGEPWFYGSPEIYCLLANSGGIANRYNMYSEWTGWGTNRSWHHVDLNMLEWHDEYSKTFGISFLESDGGWRDPFKVSYSDMDTGLSIQIEFNSVRTGDDDLGTASFHKDDAPRTKSKPYTTGSVHFVIDWHKYTTY